PALAVRGRRARLLARARLPARAAACTNTAAPTNSGASAPIPATAPLDSTGAVRVQCSLSGFEILFGANVDIALSQGSSGTYAARTLRQGAASVLQYNLYTSAARATIWGNGGGGTSTVGGAVGGWLTGQPTTRNFPIYGRLPAGQDPNLGLHSDSITVTVTF